MHHQSAWGTCMRSVTLTSFCLDVGWKHVGQPHCMVLSLLASRSELLAASKALLQEQSQPYRLLFGSSWLQCQQLALLHYSRQPMLLYHLYHQSAACYCGIWTVLLQEGG